MKLTTRNGQLDLPRDFGLTMERTNPLLSGEGDATVPATLPASPRNLAVLEHKERIDRATRFINKVDAILSVGPVQKRGQLVMDTVQRLDGIDASFAVDSSDLYTKAKDKSLKDIFKGHSNNTGYEGYTEVFKSVAAAIARMQDIYANGTDTYDYTVFPVAVAPYEENEVTVYQYNNEPGKNGLVHEERTVHEGDILMAVPEGYGIAPFLKLQKLLLRLFECLGYTVDYNCFDEAPYYSQIVVVHNCADCVVTPVLYYADLVPDCTLSEFLEFLLAKFHAQPIVDSETKTVKIVLMESMLRGTPDMDLTGKVEGEWEVQLNPSKRIVLTPTLEIDGTEAAADTFDALIDKFGEYVEVNEDEFDTLGYFSPAYTDTLVLRKATGMFYRIDRYIEPVQAPLMHDPISLQKPVPIGTNHFVYDRDNSDETEEFGQKDTVPLMLCGPKREVCPYIGERIHRHTTYNDKTEDAQQKIIVVQAHTSQNFAWRTTGTTQKHIPYASGGQAYTFWFGLDNYSMYTSFWSDFNSLLLNNPVHLKGRIKLGMGDFLNMDMGRLKLAAGQRLLPVKMSARIADCMGLTEAEFILAKRYEESVSDTAIAPSGSGNTLVWKVSNNADEVTRQAFADCIANVPYIATDWDFRSAAIDYGQQSIYLGHPLRFGEERVSVNKVSMELTVMHVYSGLIQIWKSDGQYQIREGTGEVYLVISRDWESILGAVELTTTFTAGHA